MDGTDFCAATLDFMFGAHSDTTLQSVQDVPVGNRSVKGITE
jgi:hypothetical protein